MNIRYTSNSWLPQNEIKGELQPGYSPKESDVIGAIFEILVDTLWHRNTIKVALVVLLFKQEAAKKAGQLQGVLIVV